MAVASAIDNGATGDAAAEPLTNICICGTYQRMRDALKTL